jgi:hypothetical protein
LQTGRIYLTDETRTLLTLMKFRAVGLIHGELFENPITAQQYDSLVAGNLDERRFTESVGALLVQTIKEGPAFSVSLPPRLFPELASILWQQVTDRLIEASQCEYNSFGAFRANLQGGILHVDFLPSAVARGDAPPESVTSGYGGEILVDEYCRSWMEPIRRSVLAWPPSVLAGEWGLPLIATTLLTRGLNNVWRNVLGILPARVEGDEDWLTLLAMGASFATYYAWNVAFGIALRAKSVLVLEGVGSFEIKGETVEFKPTPQLFKLLRQNISIRKRETRSRVA